MSLSYTVSKQKGGNKYYAHHVDLPYTPCIVDGHPIFGNKKDAFHVAATKEGITYEEYMKAWRKEGKK